MKKGTSTPAAETYTPGPPTQSERYRAAFYAALTGFCCNPSLLGAEHEALAAHAAERTIAANLDLLAALRAQAVV